MVAAARALDDGRAEIEASDVLLALTRDETIAPLLADLSTALVRLLFAVELRQPSFEQMALGVIMNECERTPVGVAGLRGSAEAAQQFATG
jgi:hypothetical protein